MSQGGVSCAWCPLGPSTLGCQPSTSSGPLSPSSSTPTSDKDPLLVQTLSRLLEPILDKTPQLWSTITIGSQKKLFYLPPNANRS